MKPPEILGMLEEAAGTRMYEMKKDAALRTLEKKQVKVEEINAVRRTNMLPSCNLACEWATQEAGMTLSILPFRCNLGAYAGKASGYGGTAIVGSRSCLHNCRWPAHAKLSSRQDTVLRGGPPGGWQVLKEEILPALERLRREKGQFLEWQAANANIDRLRRFCVAYRIVETERCAGHSPEMQPVL